MGDEDGSDKSWRVFLFLTLGMTCFNALARTMDSENIKEELLAKGYTHLFVACLELRWISHPLSVYKKQQF